MAAQPESALRRLVLCAFLALVPLSCDRVLIEPAPRSAALAIALTAMGGQAQAFDRADSIWVQIREGSIVRLETTLPIQSSGGSIPVSIDVPLNQSLETLGFTVELRLGQTALFRGSGTFQLRTGPVQIQLNLEPIGHALVLPVEPTVLTALGDTLRVNGAIVFATLDTVLLTPVTDWTSLDPAVVSIIGGAPVARSEGQARLIGRTGALADTMPVQVSFLVTTIVMGPTDPLLPLGTSRQYTARLTDRRGNPLFKPVTWSSSNSFVVDIDTSGLAMARSAGSAIIRAESGTASSSLSVLVRTVAPAVMTTAPTQLTPTSAVLTADVHPFGQSTLVWFVFGPDSSLVEADITGTITVPAGSAQVPVSTPVSIIPATRYYVQAHARSAGGTTAGNVIAFTSPPPAFSVVTLPPSGVTTSGATLNGVVSTDTAAASAWFEWGIDSSLSQFTSTEAVPVPPNTAMYSITFGLEGLVGRTYYYRAAARNSTGVVRGAIISLTPGSLSRPSAEARFAR
jgi:hypothetical protein